MLHWLPVILLLGLGGCQLVLPTPLPTPTSEPTQTATAEVVQATEPLASDTPQPTATPLAPADMLWLANPADGNVRLIDPISGAVAVIIPTGMQPEVVVVGEGAAWALDRQGDRVLRIDLTDFRIEAMILVPQGETNGIEVGAGYVWVGITERPSTNILLPGEEYHAAGGVVRIDPHLNQVTGYAAVGPVVDMKQSRGVLWTLARGQIETVLQRVDPSTLKFGPLDLAGMPEWQTDDCLEATDDSLWVYSQGYGRLYRFSFEGKLYAEVELGQRRPIGPAALQAGDRWVWLAAPWGSVVQVDAYNNQAIGEVSLGVPLSGVSWAGGAAWAVSALSGKAFRIDPLRHSASAPVAVGDPVLPTPVVTATAIIRASKPCEDAPYSRLAVGDYARTLKEPGLPQRLREEAGQEQERIGWIQPGERVLIQEGPACVDGWVWWKVETLTGGYVGWGAEGDEDEYWLIPEK